jgi:hypothetical protein
MRGVLLNPPLLYLKAIALVKVIFQVNLCRGYGISAIGTPGLVNTRMFCCAVALLCSGLDVDGIFVDLVR